MEAVVPASIFNSLFTGSWQRAGCALLYRLRRTFLQAVDFVLPPRCVGCRQSGAVLCERCREALPRLTEPVCERCARPCTRAVCPHCQSNPLKLTQIRAAVLFRGNVPHLVHQFKYYRLFGLAAAMAEVMQEVIPLTAVAYDLILPIPLHPQREQMRGYNQSTLLARELAGQSGVPYASTGLRRTRPTPPQAQLKAHERLVNVQGAFVADVAPVAGKRLVLVDDVCTTGATLSSAAEALYAAGATAVSAYCFARAT